VGKRNEGALKEGDAEAVRLPVSAGSYFIPSSQLYVNPIALGRKSVSVDATV
jgi:hypothetical protein